MGIPKKPLRAGGWDRPGSITPLRVVRVDDEDLVIRRRERRLSRIQRVQHVRHLGSHQHFVRWLEVARARLLMR